MVWHTGPPSGGHDLAHVAEDQRRACTAAQVEVKLVDIDLANKPPWLPTFSPHGKVPAITYEEGAWCVVPAAPRAAAPQPECTAVSNSLRSLRVNTSHPPPPCRGMSLSTPCSSTQQPLPRCQTQAPDPLGMQAGSSRSCMRAWC